MSWRPPVYCGPSAPPSPQPPRMPSDPGAPRAGPSVDVNRMAERVDCVVFGAGVVVLAVARALALAGRKVLVLVLESEHAVGQGTSSGNSKVIHPGTYYSIGSLKARLCVWGRELLCRYCSERGVEQRRLGKLIVAISGDEVATLGKNHARAEANDVHDLEWLTVRQ